MKSDKWDYVTLLPESTGVDLYKDVGMIPFTLAKEYGLHTAIVSSYINVIDTEQLDMIGAEMDVVKLTQKSRFIAGALFLIKNAKRIKCLNLYHAGKIIWIWSILYKLLNRKGIIYLKLDAGITFLLGLEGRKKGEFIKSIKLADKVSIESNIARQKLQEMGIDDVLLIPNGFFGVLGSVAGYDKENIFLTVGRIGSPEKGTEYLLQAYAMEERLHEWTLRLVGPIEDSFEVYINSYFERYPELRDKVVFTGAIYDKAQLVKEYERAKIFVLPSQWENFSIATTEALSRGCRLILSDTVSPAVEFTNGFRYGRVFPMGDILALAKTMRKYMELDYGNDVQSEIINYAKSKFEWKNICANLKETLSI